MSGWRGISVRYGGYWDDNSSYIGGGQSTAYVRTDDIRISELRGNINYFKMANSLSTTYQLHYLSRSCRGRIIKSVLSSDDELTRACNADAELEVYATDDAGTSQPEQEVYRPSFEIPSTSTYDCPSQQALLDESSDWWTNTHQHMTPPEMQQGLDISRDDLALEPVVDENDEDGSDGDYIQEEEEEDSESEEEEEERTSTMVSYGTFVEFDAWIRREGGFGKLMSTLMESNEQGGLDGVAVDEADELSNWLVPIIPQDVSKNLFAIPLEGVPDLNELSKGSIFATKNELKLAVGLWHMESRAEFVIPRSDRTRINFRCRYLDECPFLLRATWEKTFWFVRKFDDGIEASYSVAMRARNWAIELIYGGHEASFQMLPQYLHMLQETNPGTVTDLDIGPDGRFQHLFVALGSCRLAYTLCLRPVIVVDGTHLKGRNNGILFVAVTKDGNEQIFPLAYGVGPIENDVSWTWFLSRLHSAYGSNSETLIVSDAHVSISNAVRSVYPNSAHGLCYYHLLKKITRFGKPSAKLYKKAAYAYRTEDFEKWMTMLKEVNPEGGAYSKLKEVGVHKWARSQCPVPRYSFLTSNLAESFNNRLLWARRLPICSMIEAIRHIVEKWFDERHEAAKKYPADVTPEAIRKIRVEMETSRRYQVVAGVDELTFKVKQNNRTLIVDLGHRTCSCKEWQMDQIPCSHALAVIRHQGHNISQYVGVYYEATALAQAYSYRVHPVPPQDCWTIPTEVAEIRVLPPATIRQAGRPRTRRHRGPTERTSQTRRTNAVHGASSSRSRASRTCGVCGSVSHTRRGCLYLGRGE